jgi:hypothetical protein
MTAATARQLRLLRRRRHLLWRSVLLKSAAPPGSLGPFKKKHIFGADVRGSHPEHYMMIRYNRKVLGC